MRIRDFLWVGTLALVLISFVTWLLVSEHRAWEQHNRTCVAAGGHPYDLDADGPYVCLTSDGRVMEVRR